MVSVKTRSISVRSRRGLRRECSHHSGRELPTHLHPLDCVHAWNGLSYHAAKEDAEEGAQWRFEVTHIKDATTLQVLTNRFLRQLCVCLPRIIILTPSHAGDAADVRQLSPFCCVGSQWDGTGLKAFAAV